MLNVESAITELIKETVENEYTFPGEEDLKHIVESQAEEHLDRHLSDLVSQSLHMDNSVRETLAELLREFMDVEKVAREHDLENMRAEFKREVEIRSLRYKVQAMMQRIGSWFSWTFTGRQLNTRKVCLWTVLF